MGLTRIAGIQREVADTRLGGPLACVSEPMIEPADQQGVGVEHRLGSQKIRTNALAPRNMDPRAGDEVLTVASLGSSVKAQRQEAIDAALEIRVVPAREMESGNFHFGD